MNFSDKNTSPAETEAADTEVEEQLNELCETCGKWTTNDDDQCYGCMRPVTNCCC